MPLLLTVICNYRSRDENRFRNLDFYCKSTQYPPTSEEGYEIPLMNTSLSRQQERQLARQLAFLAAELRNAAECEFAFLLSFCLLVTTVNFMQLLASNTL